MAFGTPVPQPISSHQSELDEHLRGALSRTTSASRISRTNTPQVPHSGDGAGGEFNARRTVSPSAARSGGGGTTSHASGIHPYNGTGKHIQNPYFTTHFIDLSHSDTVAKREVDRTTSPRSSVVRASGMGAGLLGSGHQRSPIESVPGTKQPIPPTISLGDLGQLGAIGGGMWRDQLMRRRRSLDKERGDDDVQVDNTPSPQLSPSPVSFEPSPISLEPSPSDPNASHTHQYVVPSSLFEYFIQQKQAFDKTSAERANERVRRRKAAEEAECKGRDAAKKAFMQWKTYEEGRRGIPPVAIDLDSDWLWYFNFYKALTTIRHQHLLVGVGGEWVGPAVKVVALFAPTKKQSLLRGYDGLFSETK